jgi:DNA-binding cell septation regulator SpoVG
MSHIEPIITNFRTVADHPYLRALADVSICGFVMRGIKLEEDHNGQLYLGFPGRKVQGSWQLVCESENAQARDALLARLQTRYHGVYQEAA